MKKVKKISSWNDAVKTFRCMKPAAQELVQHFFNLHNAAVFLYNQLDASSKSYVDFLISYRPKEDEDLLNNEEVSHFVPEKNGQQFM